MFRFFSSLAHGDAEKLLEHMVFGTFAGQKRQFDGSYLHPMDYLSTFMLLEQLSTAGIPSLFVSPRHTQNETQ